jgi:uncharacterized protein YjbI with pentapeptide repeats
MGPRPNLDGANLRGANLSYKDLRDANLRDAILRDANLRDAILRDANLSSADLSYANLSYANLSSANLRDANLRGANLSSADLSYANLSYANLSSADLSDAILYGAILSDVTVPVVADLDAKIATAVGDGAALDMSAWHGHCGSTHCRAGWAITCAGAEGAALEAAVGPNAAGALIYYASTGRVPDFFASDEDALADIRACAAKASGTSQA